MIGAHTKSGRILDKIDQRLLNEFQDGFPLTPRPYAKIASGLGVSEREVIGRLDALYKAGTISRIGAVVKPHSLGWSTLAAIAVPEDRLETVAELVSGLAEVNHNYQREHRLNLWFVVAGRDKAHVARVLHDIEDRTDLAVIDLPMEESYRLALGFDLRWN
jgi:DNA-binding Lrp family transcriptional regulator